MSVVGKTKLRQSRRLDKGLFLTELLYGQVYNALLSLCALHRRLEAGRRTVDHMQQFGMAADADAQCYLLMVSLLFSLSGKSDLFEGVFFARILQKE